MTIRGFRRRRGNGNGGDPAAGPVSVEELRAEIRRLEHQNERLRAAMRHCIDCEYRIEVVARRDAAGAAADGSPADGSVPGRSSPG